MNQFPIVGLRHHDYAGRLDKLYEFAPGHRVSIAIEHDNRAEADAVVAYIGQEFAGYVRSGADRERACALIRASGRETLLGRVTGVDRQKRWLWTEFGGEMPAMPPQAESRPTVLTHWHFDGDLLPETEADGRLRAMVSNLEATIELRDPWDDDMEQWLLHIEQNLWRDISRETFRQITRIIDLLTCGGEDRPDYAPGIARLQVAIDHMASPESTQERVALIFDRAASKDMDILLGHYGETAREIVAHLPKPVATLFEKDAEELLSRLWYLHLPREKTRALLSLLAMKVRIQADEADEKSVPATIPTQWMIKWTGEQNNPATANVVKDLISSYEMERSNPLLAGQMQQMVDGCSPARQQARAAESQQEALKAIASRPSTQINQLNMGDGTQQLPPGTNLPKLPAT